MLPVPIRRRTWREPLASYNPFTEAFQRLFPEPWGWELAPSQETERGGYPVDIREEDDVIHVEAEMPGFSRDEISVDLDDNVLRISAERTPPETKGTTHLNERRWVQVERSFTLPAPVDESKAEAKLDDGVLRLDLPKTESRRPRRIEIR